MNFIRAAIAIAISIMMAGKSIAAPLPTTQLTDTLMSLRGAHVKIDILNRKPVIRVYHSATGESAQCFILFAPETLSVLDKSGYEFFDFSVIEPGPGTTETECMTRPIAQ